MEETKIPPPVNPLTLAINLWILRQYAAYFMGQNLPNYSRVVTSDSRTPEHNREVGGADNSAHVHNLAEDFQLRVKATGALVPESQARKVWQEQIRPAWPGFSEFESAAGGEGYHIHWNLSREVSSYSGLVSTAGIGVLGFVMIRQYLNNGAAA